MSSTAAWRALDQRMVEKPWGVATLPAPFSAPPGQTIGEVWFEPPPELAGVLVKYLFTSERLSVQVHPSDAQLRAAGHEGRGKEECWLVLAAEPDAVLGVGFTGAVDREVVRQAALDGSIEQLLAWHHVAPGDFIYIPAGTAHAIGAGITLLEVQQNSDITYRLYDYGRPRPLHLDEGMAVVSCEAHAPALRRQVAPAGEVELVAGPLFRVTRAAGPASAGLRDSLAGRPVLIVPLRGELRLCGEPVAAGSCLLAESLDLVEAAASAHYLVIQDLACPA